MQRPYLKELAAAIDLINAGRTDEGEAILEPLLRSHPLDAYLLYNLGLCRWRQKRRLEAVALYRRALGADPELLPAMVNLSSCLFELGDTRESLRYIQMAVRRNPDEPTLLLNLALVLTAAGEADDALQALDHALAVRPDHLGCLTQRMIALTELGQLKLAKEAALAILAHPRGGTSVEALNNVVSIASKFSDWATLDAYVPRLEETIRNLTTDITPMALTFNFDDPEMMGHLAHLRSKAISMPPRPGRPGNAERITVAYMSPDLREHPVAHMVLDVLRRHDRTAFRIITVGILPEVRSPLSDAIAACVDEHIDLTKLDDSQAAALLRTRQVDVLVDLAGSTKWCRPEMLHKRPCPVQVLWLGCPCTTGTPYYDAFLVDPVVAPPGYEQHCTEPLLRLPCCYHPITTGFGEVATDMRRSRVKLPDDAIVVGMLQQPNKIRPPLIDDVVRVLARHPRTHLWVRVHQEGIEAAERRFTALGLPPERVTYAPLFKQRDDYLAIYGLVDVLVDSFPYGGHSTTGEALIQGTPVLTIAGRSIHTRVAASMLHEMGLDDLAFPDRSALCQTLDGLLAAPDRLAALRRRCGTAVAGYRQDGLARLTRELEQAYRRLLHEASTPRQDA